MANRFAQYFARGPNRSDRRLPADNLSWLARAMVNAVAVGPTAGSPDLEAQPCRAPAFVQYFGRTQRNTRRSQPLSPLRVLLVAACMALLWPGCCLAQARCDEGKSATGACVDSGLARTARQSAVIFAQPKISLTAYPVLPSADSSYRYPHQLNPAQDRPGAVGVIAPTSGVVVPIVIAPN